jgi:hypothetical protein
MNAPGFVCEARRMGTLMACGRCAAVFPNAGEHPGCAQSPSPPIGLEEIKTVVLSAADMIEDSQDILVRLRIDAEAHGDTRMSESLRNAPRMSELRRAAVMRAVARLIERIEGDAEIKKRLRGQGNGSGDRGQSAA